MGIRLQHSAWGQGSPSSLPPLPFTAPWYYKDHRSENFPDTGRPSLADQPPCTAVPVLPASLRFRGNAYTETQQIGQTVNSDIHRP